MARNIMYLLGLMAATGAITGCSVLPTQAPAPVYGTAGEASPPPAAPRSPAPGPQSAQRAEAILQVLTALGVDYRYGGSSYRSGFDCSGLVAHVYREALGISLPHSTRGLSKTGFAIDAADLQAGDLVFFNTQGRPFSHVGIYIGDGRFVHAPKTGERVRVARMSNRYWSRRFDGARRIPTGATERRATASVAAD